MFTKCKPLIICTVFKFSVFIMVNDDDKFVCKNKQVINNTLVNVTVYEKPDLCHFLLFSKVLIKYTVYSVIE